MYQDQSDADVFYATRIVWALLPLLATLLCVLVWLLVSKLKTVNNLVEKMKASIVILLYLLWPGLSSETFALFACQEVCGENRLRVDVNELCFVNGGRHSSFAFGLGIPMLLFYVVGLPLLALVMVVRVQRRSKEQNKELHTMKGHYTFGLFYSAYHPDVWWWESTVALRKILISLIGVFGGSMGQMQVHLTAYMMVIIMLLTAMVRPFGDHFLLQCLDLATLAAVWMTLWAGTVFNDHPRCEDGAGGTLAWCDLLSVVVGVVVVLCLVFVVAVIVYYKKKARAASQSVEKTSKKKRRVSSRELMIEMSTQPLQTNTQAAEEGEGEVKCRETEDEGEGGGEVIVTLGVNPMHGKSGEAAPGKTASGEAAPISPISPATTTSTVTPTATPNAAGARWNTLKHATRASRTFRKGGKQRIKRLSKVMKARHNESGGGESGGESGSGGGDSIDGENEALKMETDVEAAVSMHVDVETGRRYSYDAATGHTQWLSDDGDTKNGATIEEQGERKQESGMRRISFRKIVNDDNAVFFQNVETRETVWNLPKNGDLVV